MKSPYHTKTIVYCFPGQGSDGRIFKNLTLDSGFELQVVPLADPEKGMDMRSYAREMSKQIDTSRESILLGVSLGGMICVELNEILSPAKTILISSAKNRNELPWRYRIQRTLPVYSLLPGRFLLAGAKKLQPLVEPDRNRNKETFVSMLDDKHGLYMKRTVRMIVNWDRQHNTKPLHHIHGSNDHTLPLAKIKPPIHTVGNGSHMMTLTRAEDISRILNTILTGEI